MEVCGGYRISSYNFRGKYSFLNLEIQRSHYIRPKVTVHKCAGIIRMGVLFEGGSYEEILYSISYKGNLPTFLSDFTIEKMY